MCLFPPFLPRTFQYSFVVCFEMEKLAEEEKDSFACQNYYWEIFDASIINVIRARFNAFDLIDSIFVYIRHDELG
jgi:hypothetical protein